jgi:hypothetical protein
MSWVGALEAIVSKLGQSELSRSTYIHIVPTCILAAVGVFESEFAATQGFGTEIFGGILGGVGRAGSAGSHDDGVVEEGEGVFAYTCMGWRLNPT